VTHDRDPRWILTGVLVGIALALSIASFFLLSVRPFLEPPQVLVSVDVQGNTTRTIETTATPASRQAPPPG
jgi:hypothetical protein